MWFTTPWLVVAGMVLSTSTGEFCNKTMVRRAWQLCDEAYIPDTQNGDIDTEEVCQGIDCLIQCRQDAIGDCLNDDEFLDVFHMYDAEMWKVYFRAACSNTALAAEISGADDHCSITRTCTNQQNPRANLPGLYADGKYDEYRELLCSTSANSQICISVNVTENCSSTTAKYYEDLLKILSSHSICENTDLQHLYTNYGGAVTCVNPKVNSKCFASYLMSKVSKCVNVSLQTIAGDQDSAISELCDSVECTAKCYTDAIGDCENEDNATIIMDSTSIKVASRASCANKEELIAAYKECKMQNQSCYSELGQGMSDASTLLDQLNYAAYRNAVCSTNSRFRNCVSYIADGNCTQEMASLLNGIMDVTYSYATCGAQDHAYFTTYGGDINCDTSASGTPLTNTLLCCILFLAAILFN